MKNILVTGGNRGIGLEICRQLDQMGHRVILCSRDSAKGKKAAEQMSRNVLVRQLDVTEEENIRDLFKDLEQEPGQLDVLINNAGISPKGSGIVTDTSLEGVGEIMDVNLYGPWRMIQALLPLLKKSPGGRIINMSSGMGELRNLTGDHPGYRLSKTSLNALTIMFADELKNLGILVNAMCPGWVRTDMGGPNAPRDVRQGADTAVWLATEKNIPTGKFFRDREQIEW